MMNDEGKNDKREAKVGLTIFQSNKGCDTLINPQSSIAKPCARLFKALYLTSTLNHS